MAVAVGLGAFGAHGLKSRVDADMIAIWETAARYHAWHALGLMVIAGFMQVRGIATMPMAPYFLIVGVVVFSGSLYTMVLTDMSWLGAITPIGGLSFIIGWGLLAVRSIQ